MRSIPLSVRALALLLLCASAACGTSRVGPPPSAPQGTATDSASERLSRRVHTLAHDSLRGREVGSPGALGAARYLADALREMGLKPGGVQGTYYDPVALRRRRTAATLHWETEGSTRLVSREDALPVSGLGGLPGSSRTRGEGAVVYAGYLVDPEIGEAELELRELKDAVVVVQLGAPDGVDLGTAMARIPLAALFSEVSPAAAVLLVPEADDRELWAYAEEIARRGEVERDLPRVVSDRAPFFVVSRSWAEGLLGRPLEQARAPVRDLGVIRYEVVETADPLEGWNVVGILPGSDPERAAEHVALGAHYDHVGVGEPVGGDSIYNGADDNASGAAALLEVASHASSLTGDERPARSLLFVWHTAEEHGLLGAESLLEKPPVAREAIVAHLNLDMVGRNHPDSIFVVGSRRHSSALDERLQAVNQRQPHPFVLDYSYDAPGHPERVYCRSDHYAYGRAGIPVVFLTSGLHADYHRPDDEADRIDYGKLARVSRLVADLAREIADLPHRLPIDQPASSPEPGCG